MEGDCCILPLFDTIFRSSEKKLKGMHLNGAFSRCLIRYFGLQRKFENKEAKWWMQSEAF